MAKENKSKLIIWATVALVIGVILGLLITNITTTGKAKSALASAPVRQEANLQEARQDLILNLLRVNTIESRGDDLLINANTGMGRVYLFGSGMANVSAPIVDISGPTATSISNTENSILLGSDGLNIFAHNLKISNSNQTGYVEPIFIIDAENESIQMNAGGSIITQSVDSQIGPIMNLGSHWLSLTGNHIGIGNDQSTAISINPEGEIQLQNLSTGNEMDYNGPESAYACLTADGTLYRSYNPCN